MQKQKLFKKLSFIMALVMIASSLCTPVMAEPGAVSAAEGEETEILKGDPEISPDMYEDEKTGFTFWLYNEDPDDVINAGWDCAIITGHKDGTDYNETDPVIPDTVYVGDTLYFVEYIWENAFKGYVKMTGTLSINGFGERTSGDPSVYIGVMGGAFSGCTGLTGLFIGEYAKIVQVDDGFKFTDCAGRKEIEYHCDGELDLDQFGLGSWYNDRNREYSGKTDFSKIPGNTLYKDPKKEYTVSFNDWEYDENYKKTYKKIDSITLLAGDSVNDTPGTLSDPKEEDQPKEPETKEGYDFTCWCTDKDGKNKYDLDSAVNENIDLYAGWKETYTDKFYDVLGRTDETKLIPEVWTWFKVNDEEKKTATIIKNPENDSKDRGVLEDYIEKDLEIPAKVRNVYGREYTVTEIDDKAYNNLYMRYSGSLKIPEGIEKIGSDAFADYSQLTGALTIPSSVTAIGANAFSGCAGFAGPLSFGGDASKLTSLGSGAFSGCAGLTGSLAFPKGITSISDSAFSGCARLTGTLTVPGSITAIGDSAFANCTDFTVLQLNEGLTKIGARAFTGDKFAGQLKLPNTVEDIGESAFEECKGFTGLILGTGVKYISSKAFRNCTDFTGVLTIPNGVLTIGPNAFDGCKGFTGDLIIPDSVTTLNGGAFFGCTGFGPWLVVGSGITEFGDRYDMNGNDDVFSGCTGIKAINNKMAKFSINVKDMLPAGGDLVWREGSKNGTPLIAGAGLQAGKMGYRSDFTGEEKAPESVEDPNSLSGNNAPMDYTQVEKASGEIKMVITYPKKIPFFGKSKLKPSDLGDNFTVSVNNQTYKVSKMKINKKSKRIQIIKLEGVTDKAINKAIKKETKGDKGLVFEISKFNVGSSTEVTPKIKTKKGVTTLKSVKVKVFGDKLYKAKKGEARLSDDGKYIEFSGDNLEGRRLLN